MIFSNLKNIVVAIATLVSIGNGTTAFVPEDTRVRIGAGRSIISIPSESLSFALHYQKPPKRPRRILLECQKPTFVWITFREFDLRER